jgi:hypothetical protein
MTHAQHTRGFEIAHGLREDPREKWFDVEVWSADGNALIVVTEGLSFCDAAKVAQQTRRDYPACEIVISRHGNVLQALGPLDGSR